MVNGRFAFIGDSLDCHHGNAEQPDKRMVFDALKGREIYKQVGVINVYEKIQSEYDDSTLSAQLMRIQQGLQPLPAYEEGIFVNTTENAIKLDLMAKEQFSKLSDVEKMGCSTYRQWLSKFQEGFRPEKVVEEVSNDAV